MTGFRGSDDILQREIEALEAIARLRLKRHVADLRTLERELRELKAERARRRARSHVGGAYAEATATARA